MLDLPDFDSAANQNHEAFATDDPVLRRILEHYNLSDNAVVFVYTPDSNLTEMMEDAEDLLESVKGVGLILQDTDTNNLFYPKAQIIYLGDVFDRNTKLQRMTGRECYLFNKRRTPGRHIRGKKRNFTLSIPDQVHDCSAAYVILGNNADELSDILDDAIGSNPNIHISFY